MPSLAHSPPPWLSVLLPVHGAGAHLLACARSLVAQAVDGVELLLLDASSEGASAALEGLEHAHPGRVRVLQGAERRGLGAARNRLLDEARGEYVWLLDADDRVEPGAIASLQRIVERHRPDLVMCDYRVFDDGGGRPDPGDDHVVSFRGRGGALLSDRDSLLFGLFRTGELQAGTKVIRRASWPAQLRFPEARWLGDLAVMPRVLLGLTSFFHAREVWLGCRKRPGSELAALTIRKLDDWMEAMSGYAAELGALRERLSARTEQAIAMFCAESWMGAGPRADAPQPSELERRLRRHAATWSSACPWPAERLERALWRTGRFGRALRWNRWRRRAGL